MMRRVTVFCGAVLVLSVGVAIAQERVNRPITNEAWERPFPGFRIAGDLYYVGTYDLAAYVISTTEGLILINSGAPGSYPLMKESIESLGLSVSDIRIITTTQGHWDHVGDLAEFKRVSGASVHVSEPDAPVLESGGHLDYRLPEGRGIIYDPIDVDRTIADGDTIRLGETELTAHAHSGHTPGSMSFSFSTQDDERAYNVLVANMNSINTGVKLLDSPGYPTIAKDFARTLSAQANMTPDIWVSSHARHFNLHDIYAPGDPYDPARFGDLAAYRAKVAGYQQAYDEQLAEERQAAR